MTRCMYFYYQNLQEAEIKMSVVVNTRTIGKQNSKIVYSVYKSANLKKKREI